MTKLKLPEKVSDINPANYNPRKISEEGLHGLDISLSEFGDISGFVYNIKTNCLVCGHQRLKTIPNGSKIIITSKEPDKKGTVATGYIEHADARYGIRFVDWSEIKEKAANVAANNPAIQGTFLAEINIILDEIKTGCDELYTGLLLEEVRVPSTIKGRGIDGINLNDFFEPKTGGETPKKKCFICQFCGKENQI